MMELSDALNQHFRPKQPQCEINPQAEEIFLKIRYCLSLLIAAIEKEVPGFRAWLTQALQRNSKSNSSSLYWNVSSYTVGKIEWLSAKQPSLIRGNIAVLFVTKELPETELILTGGSQEGDADEIQMGEVGLILKQKWFEPMVDCERRHKITMKGLGIDPVEMENAQQQVAEGIRKFFATMGHPRIVPQLRGLVEWANETIQK